MGAFLDKPITEKEYHVGAGNGVEWAVAHMQGWRVSMEVTAGESLGQGSGMSAAQRGGRETTSFTWLALAKIGGPSLVGAMGTSCGRSGSEALDTDISFHRADLVSRAWVRRAG